MIEAALNNYLPFTISCVLSCVFQQRGSTRDGTGVHDSIVNQLLTKVGYVIDCCCFPLLTR